MQSIVHAAKQTKLACQKTFSDMRWNCSSIVHAPHFTPDLEKGTRESAVVFALASAAVSHSISRACASGELPSCSCGPAPAEQAGPDFRWGGCGDNLRYGLQMGQCNKTSNGSDSCNLMCCGRGYNAYTEKIVERCQCKYHWCCYVTCKKCERTVERYVCK
ncbi:UNVERIFIED_CONTAM: hypothetical protein FKN15_008546 [Acipenser sinensis]